MYAIGQKKVSPIEITGKEQGGESFVTAQTKDEPYRFFKEGTPYSAIDAALWPKDCKFSDAQHLQHFRDLKALAAPEHLDKFALVLMSDRMDSKHWFYMFSLNEAPLYKGELQPIGHDLALLDEYEDEFLRQAFPADSFEKINAELQTFREDASKGWSCRERVERFVTLSSQVPESSSGLFLKHLKLQQAEGKWSYQLSVGLVSLYSSETFDIGDGDDAAYFQHLVLLQRIRQEMNFPKELADSAVPFKKIGAGLDACLAKSLESIAYAIMKMNETASIAVTKDTYGLMMGDRLLQKAEIPLTPEGQGGATARVHIAMSALRVAFSPIGKPLAAIMQSFENYQLTVSTVGEKSGTPLRKFMQAKGDGVELIRATPTYDRQTYAQIYSLAMVSGTGGGINFFSVASSAEAGRAAASKGFFSSALSSVGSFFSTDYKLAILSGLCGTMKNDIYSVAVSSMNGKEKEALHALMHETLLDGISLGQIMNVPKPI